MKFVIDFYEGSGEGIIVISHRKHEGYDYDYSTVFVGHETKKAKKWLKKLGVKF